MPLAEARLQNRCRFTLDSRSRLFIKVVEYFIHMKTAPLPVMHCHALLDVYGLWAGGDLYRAIPAVKRDHGFCCRIRRTAPLKYHYENTAFFWYAPPPPKFNDSIFFFTFSSKGWSLAILDMFAGKVQTLASSGSQTGSEY